jgi:hypothetical protein
MKIVWQNLENWKNSKPKFIVIFGHSPKQITQLIFNHFRCYFKIFFGKFIFVKIGGSVSSRLERFVD